MRRILHTVYFNFGVCLQQAENNFLRHYYSRQVILFPDQCICDKADTSLVWKMYQTLLLSVQNFTKYCVSGIKLSIRKDELCFFYNFISLVVFILKYKLQRGLSKFSFRKAPLLP
jgi:hypothetical protein